MLWTVFEESSEDGDYYDRPPPGNLDNFYDLASQVHGEDMVEPEPVPVSGISKMEFNEKQVEEMVVPADDELEDHIDEPADLKTEQQRSIEFPDGSLRAWLVILGTLFSAFASFGYVRAWRVFQVYYEETILNEYSPSTIAWIGSVQYAFVLFPALFCGRLLDLGIFKTPFLFASILLVACTFLVGQCTQYWQLFLCQGIGVGIGCGMVFAPAMEIVGQWFKRRRGLAMGITTLGASIGGTVLPIAAQKLISRIGFSWTMRILGFILLFVLVIPNITLARCLLPPPQNISRGLFNFAMFRNPPFLTYAIAVFTGFFGWYTVLAYIDHTQISVGLSPDMIIYVIAMSNASSGLGMVISGHMADRIGALNTIAPTTLFTGAVSFAWPFARTKTSLIAVAVLYGFTSGTFISCLLLPVYKLGEVANAGQHTGMIMSIGSFGALFSLPISGAIDRLNMTGGVEFVGYYAGSITLISVVFMIITRQLTLGRLWGKI